MRQLIFISLVVLGGFAAFLLLGVAYAQGSSAPLEIGVNGQILQIPLGDLTFPGSILIVGGLLINALPKILSQWTPTLRVEHAFYYDDLPEDVRDMVVKEMAKRRASRKPVAG